MTITAQHLYDRRERLGEISGADLHDLFRLLCDGEPSPVGRTPITRKALLDVWHDGPSDRDMQDFISEILGHGVTHEVHEV